MPSRLFTRAHVLERLSDDEARQEADSIPHFIYLFLRDVFFAVDVDGDGIVTAAAVSRLFPTLSPPAGPARDGLTAPVVRPAWWSPTSYVAPTRAGAAATPLRPLDLCDFMQTYWPLVSDKMARRVSGAWDLQSRSGGASAAAATADADAAGDSHCGCAVPSSPSPSPSPSPPRRAVFSPSPFRVVESPSPAWGTGTLEDADPEEQRRLYGEAVRHLWPDAAGVAHSARDGVSVAAAPRRLLTDEDVDELLTAFTDLDRSRSGLASAADVSAALESLLISAVSEAAAASDAVTGAPHEEREQVRRLAEAMVAQAVCGVAASSSPRTESDGLWLTCTTFVRSFQCDTGAFPAELVAWCAARARASRATAPAWSSWRALAASPAWMAPVECAYVQQLLLSYVDLLQTEDVDAAQPPRSTSTRTTTSAAAALSPRLSVNTPSTKRPSHKESPPPPPPTIDAASSCCHEHPLVTNATVSALQRWRCQARQAALHAVEEGEEEDTTTLPADVLEFLLREDLLALLCRGASSFSASVAAALEEVAAHHARAVGALGRRVAVPATPLPSQDTRTGDTTSPPPSLPVHGRGGRRRAAAVVVLVDMERLVDLVTADPRYLRLEVVVPLAARLKAVEDALQHHPRRAAAEAASLLSAFVREAPGPNGVGLVELLRLRHALTGASPLLARLIVGATSLRGGGLCLEDCLAVLASHAASVPPSPLPLPLLARLGGADAGAPPTSVVMSVAAAQSHPCHALLADARILQVSRGWLRYACRRMPPREQRATVAALRTRWCGVDGGLLDVAACDGEAPPPGEGRDGGAAPSQSPPVHVVYEALLAQVRSGSWVCRVDPVMAAHVALVLVAAGGRADSAAPTETDSGSRVWWSAVPALLAGWVAAQSEHQCTPAVADAWAMSAISSVSVLLGPACCRAVTHALSRVRVVAAAPGSRAVLVEEEELTLALTAVVREASPLACASAWAVDTLVGSCPCPAAAQVDLTWLLRRWLEAHPLPLPALHLSLCCAINEVEAVYYTLKRLAASEESRRRRRQCSETPADAAAALLVTGISPVCLSELLENEDVLVALYAISPPEAVGVWGGALRHLSPVLRPLLLGATGVRVSLDKLGPPARGRERGTGAAESAQTASGAASAEPRESSWSPLADAVVSMAVPACVQHAIAQLFARVDLDNTGAVSEEQLRSHRARVPAPARYGWHRFVSALCSRRAFPVLSSAAAPSPVVVAGAPAAGVVRLHQWQRGRRHATPVPSTTATPPPSTKAAADDAMSTSIDTGVDDGGSGHAATTFTLGEMVMRVAELRTCVLAQLLTESRACSQSELAVVVPTKPRPPLVSNGPTADAAPPSGCVGGTSAATPPTAGTARWWAAYVEELCHCYSGLVA
ncbi:hypothetical protein NESM_000616100 [Novymonas esmeraldas]|uniref:EF-hand domain-containing protein n=1 Tax=Novymonas esmeraldas TaxID=1808958 RepID=A0AAW0ETC0_9TRYP